LNLLGILFPKKSALIIPTEKNAFKAYAKEEGNKFFRMQNIFFFHIQNILLFLWEFACARAERI
jgi:hypothetical protein